MSHFYVVFYTWATLPIFFDTASTGAVAQRLMRLSSKQEIPGSNPGSAFKENCPEENEEPLECWNEKGVC